MNIIEYINILLIILILIIILIKCKKINIEKFEIQHNIKCYNIKIVKKNINKVLCNFDYTDDINHFKKFNISEKNGTIEMIGKNLLYQFNGYGCINPFIDDYEEKDMYILYYKEKPCTI